MFPGVQEALNFSLIATLGFINPCKKNRKSCVWQHRYNTAAGQGVIAIENMHYYSRRACMKKITGAWVLDYWESYQILCPCALFSQAR